ncbi:hypothetical protein SPRG_19059, partial [Saprolegnia parasitica CBS 223.65]
QKAELVHQLHAVGGIRQRDCKRFELRAARANDDLRRWLAAELVDDLGNAHDQQHCANDAYAAGRVDEHLVVNEEPDANDRKQLHDEPKELDEPALVDAAVVVDRDVANVLDEHLAHRRGRRNAAIAEGGL